MKKIKIKTTKNFFLYIIGGALLFLAGVLFCPLWKETSLPWASWGQQIVDLIICACLLLYLFGFLGKKILRSPRGAVGVLTAVEFAALFLVAVGCVLSQFRVLNIAGACTILGFCLWCRGTVEIFRAYFYQKGSAHRYPLWWLCVAIAMVSLGMYCIARPLFSDTVVLWIFVLALLLGGGLLLTYGILAKPKKVKPAAPKPVTETNQISQTKTPQT